MVSTSRRSRLEMYIDVLRAIAEGKKKPTGIMFRANLIWPMLQDALDTLVQRALIVETIEGDRRTYELTQKGARVLQYFMEVYDVLSAEPLPDYNTTLPSTT